MCVSSSSSLPVDTNACGAGSAAAQTRYHVCAFIQCARVSIYIYMCVHMCACMLTTQSCVYSCMYVCAQIIHHRLVARDPHLPARIHSMRRIQLHARATQIRQSASSSRRLPSRRNFDASRPLRHRHHSFWAFSRAKKHLVALVSRLSSSSALSLVTRTRISPAKPSG